MYDRKNNTIVIGSSIFLVLQSIILVDFTRSFSEEWISKYDETRSIWLAIIIVSLTISAYIICIFAAIWIYMFYNSELSITLVSINVLLSIVFSLLSINHKIQKMNAKTGILPSAVLALYNGALIS